jgi:hypothetical protein
MDDNLGYPHFRKASYYGKPNQNCNPWGKKKTVLANLGKRALLDQHCAKENIAVLKSGFAINKAHTGGIIRSLS